MSHAEGGMTASELNASLTVDDVQRSADWYCTVLGFVVDRKHERNGVLIAISLKAGAVRLLVTQDDGAGGKDRVKGLGFSLQIVTADVDQAAERVRRAGHPFDTEPATTPWGARMFRVRDPDGFRFTISTG